MALFQDSAQTPERRNEEAKVIFEKFLNWFNWLNRINIMTSSEVMFINKLYGMYARHKKVFVSVEELFWLRDLMEKYL
jgi:hypothetical protein